MKNNHSAQKIISILCALILLVSCSGILSACQPKHTCQSVCESCGKCLNANCTESVCTSKCPGHHTCTSQCEKCGKCLNRNCQESACQQKCPRDHHECRTTCDNCGKCMDYFCPQPECATKCACPHTCESVCPTCNKCTDIYCKNPICQQKCDQAPMIGHNVSYTGTITAIESDVVITEFTQRPVDTRWVGLISETGGASCCIGDPDKGAYETYSLNYDYDFCFSVCTDVLTTDELTLVRHPCNIPNMSWTNVIFIYKGEDVISELYYNSPLPLDVNVVLTMAHMTLQYSDAPKF